MKSNIDVLNVGDKVVVKSLEWYKNEKNMHGDITFENNPHFFSPEMCFCCGQELTIEYVFGDPNKLGYEYYFVKENGFFWTKDMFLNF